MSPDPVRHSDTIIFPASLDPQAVSVVRRLREAGYESYLVGGCVRDLLLGHIPKDFDASTEARPRQIRRVFRNCRIIGRRFKLAHVHFGDHIIEVATFRRNPTEAGDSTDGDSDEDASLSVREDDVDGNQDNDTDSDADDLLITRDNVYGTSEEDTLRRDFTINALLYDVLTDEVIDYVGGVKDVENKILRTIGDPMIRIAEDPVRMLRAVKFTARLGLTMDAALDAAMRASAELIDRSAPPRVLEEIYKMLTCGVAARALELLLEYGLLERLLPELADHWKQRPEECVRLGAALDHVDRAKRRVDNSFVLALLFHDVWRDSLEGEQRVDPLIAARELIAPAAQRMNIPRRDVSSATQLLLNQSRLERSRRGRRFRMADFLARETTVTALDLLYVRCLAGLADPECHARWAMRLVDQRGSHEVPGAPAAARSGESRESRTPRKRRGGRRRSGSRQGSGRGTGDRDDRPSGERNTGGRKEPSARTEEGDTQEAAKGGSSADKPKRRRSRGGRNRSRSSRSGGASPAREESGKPKERGDSPAPEASRDTRDTKGAAAEPTSTDKPQPVEPHVASTREEVTRKAEATAVEAGLTGRIKGLLRRVIGRSASTQTPPTAAATSASPATAPPSTTDRRKADTEATQPARRKRPADEKSPAAGSPARADGTSRGPEAPGQGSAASDSEGDAKTGAGSRSSRRPRRRRRGGASRSRSSTGAEKGSGEGAAEAKDESGGGGDTTKRPPRRRTRGGGGDSRKKSSSGSGRAKGGKGKSSRPKTKASGTESKAGKQAKDPTPDPSGRHPEDVEDMFDW